MEGSGRRIQYAGFASKEIQPVLNRPESLKKKKRDRLLGKPVEDSHGPQRKSPVYSSDLIFFPLVSPSE